MIVDGDVICFYWVFEFEFFCWELDYYWEWCLEV